MKFFVPDWDDRVDPDFDFLTDRFSLGRDPYRDDVYAHELMETRVYDGVLVSRSAINGGGPKRALIEASGVRRYLRLTPDLELMGDCGAFSYVRDKLPRYDTEEIVDFYDRYDFDYGVSVDHLIVPEFESERDFRYELTLDNAERFLGAHRRGAYRFTPIGAVQGWDIPSYVSAARAVVNMGYCFIAIGGLARSATKQVQEIVAGIIAAIPKDVRVHVFGVARASLVEFFLEIGVSSADSAAPLRQAWLSSRDNYYASGRTYAAVRIPMADEERARASDTILARSPVREGGLIRLRNAEKSALRAIRMYASGRERLSSALDAIMEYDGLLGARRFDKKTDLRRREQYRESLADKPWRSCKCSICQDLGVEVIIFRGNNRNRRRGFHNLYVTYQRLSAFHTEAPEIGLEGQLTLSMEEPLRVRHFGLAPS